MIHRHLNHQRFSRAAVDDIISRGVLSDWAELRAAVRRDPAVRQSVDAVCTAYMDDPYAQRHRFWLRYSRSLNGQTA